MLYVGIAVGVLMIAVAVHRHRSSPSTEFVILGGGGVLLACLNGLRLTSVQPFYVLVFSLVAAALAVAAMRLYGRLPKSNHHR